MMTLKDLSSEARQLVAFYEENYELIGNIELPSNASKKIYLGSRENRCCRFCGTTAKRAFRQTAHTLPEALGNKSLISLDECDECNKNFGRLLDEHFARFLGLHRTVHQISGKKGVPAYGVPGRRPKLRRVGPNQFAGEAYVADDFIEIDEHNRRGKIKGYKQPYIKRSVFKCLTKIALAILPVSELENFETTLAWIRQDPSCENPSDRFYCFTSDMDMMRDGIDLILLRRRDSEARLPYVSFYLFFSTRTFQIFLPFCKRDRHLVGETIQLQHFPNRAERITNVHYDLLDLSSPEMVRDEVDYVGFEIGEPGVIVERQNAVSCTPHIEE